MASVNIAASDNITGIRLKEQASSPTTPPSGYAQLYVNTTPAVQFEDDAGTVRTLSDTTHTHAAADITSGTLANARVNWAAPSAIGGTTAAAGTFSVLTVASGAGQWIEVGASPTGNQYAYIDLIGDTTYSDYGLRIVRNNTGANASSDIEHRGTGDLNIRHTEAGSIKLREGATVALTVTAATVTVAGALTKGSGSFLIDHPLDTMPDYTLRHEFVEAPRADLLYRGVAEFANNQTEVTMSIDASSRMTAGTFVALTQNPVIHVSNNDTWELVRGRVVGGDVVIERKDGRGKLTVDWLVIAERADDFIKTVDYTDEDGRVIPEQRKEALDEDAVMQTIEAFDDDMPEEEVRTRVAELVRGKGNNKMRGVLKDNRSRAKVDELVKRKRKKGKRNEQ